MKWLKLLLLPFPLFAHLAANDLNDVTEAGAYQNQKTAMNSKSSQRSSSQKAQPMTKQKDLFLLDIGAVYLRPYQGGTDFAQKIYKGEAGDQEPYGKNQGLDFHFDWGFRAGIGYQGGQSRQTFKATYLYLASNASKTVSGDFVNDAVLTSLVQNTNGDGIGDLFLSAHSHWNLHFNMLDLTFGKKFPKLGCMTFEPFIGGKGILLSENQKYSYNQDKKGFSVKLTQKVDFQGAGLMGGLSLDWSISRWVSLFGSFDAALLYSSVKTTRTSDNGLPTLLWIGSSHDIKGTPVLEGSLGLKGVYCWKNGRFIELKVGFEGHQIFNTMKHSFTNSDSSTDLSLMGWFATIGFGF